MPIRHLGRWETRRLELRKLRYFDAVAEAESYRRAAERLHIAQPAISRQIQDLEWELKVQLFERLPRGVRLTAAGRAFAEEVKQILSAIDGAVRLARDVQLGQAGFLRVGFTDLAACCDVTMGAVRRFRASRPKIKFDMIPMMSFQQIEEVTLGRLDAGLIHYSYTTLSNLNIIEIVNYQTLLALPTGHPLTKKVDLVLEDLHDCDFVATAGHPSVRLNLIEELRLLGFRPQIIQESPSTTMTMELVAAGVGVAFVHSGMQNRPHPHVTMRTVVDAQMPRTLGLVWNPGHVSPGLVQFIDSIEEAKRSHIEAEESLGA
jgi:DNA-binding transcriptional LysR family regulator